MAEQFHIVKIGERTARIPEAEIAKQMKLLDISREEAIDLWLEDNDYQTNDEVEALTKKAKINGVTPASCVKARSATTKTQRERVKKDDPTKEMIIKTLAECLGDIATNVTVVDNRKVITFNVGDDLFKLDLSRTRKKA